MYVFTYKSYTPTLSPSSLLSAPRSYHPKPLFFRPKIRGTFAPEYKPSQSSPLPSFSKSTAESLRPRSQTPISLPSGCYLNKKQRNNTNLPLSPKSSRSAHPLARVLCPSPVSDKQPTITENLSHLVFVQTDQRNQTTSSATSPTWRPMSMLLSRNEQPSMTGAPRRKAPLSLLAIWRRNCDTLAGSINGIPSWIRTSCRRWRVLSTRITRKSRLRSIGHSRKKIPRISKSGPLYAMCCLSSALFSDAF